MMSQNVMKQRNGEGSQFFQTKFVSLVNLNWLKPVFS